LTAAVMMQYGTVRLSNYTEAGLNDPAALAMARCAQQIPENEKASYAEIQIKTLKRPDSPIASTASPATCATRLCAASR
jgi:hypothetical protein